MGELAGGQPHQTTGLVETAGLQGARTAITVDAPTIYNGAGILCRWEGMLRFCCVKPEELAGEYLFPAKLFK